MTVLITITKFIVLLLAIWSTVFTINYKYTTAIKLFKFHEEEDKKMGVFSVVVMHICVLSWAVYFTFF